MTQERGLARMRQIAKEEKAAVRAGDTETLCRLTEMLPALVESLESRVESRDTRTATLDKAVLDEIRQAHEQAERYLQEQMRSVKLLLQQCSTARRTLRAYGKRGAVVQVDGRG